MKKTILLCSTVLLLFLFSAKAQNIQAPRFAGDATLTATALLGSPAVLTSSSFTAVVDANAVYSNVTSFSGNYATNSAAAVVGTNTITAFLGDSLGLTGTSPYSINKFRFSIVNANGAAMTYRPIVYFYQNNGVANSPGTLLASYSFNAITQNAGTISVYTGNVPTNPFTIPTGTTGIWMGMTFDNNNGATPITIAQLNNLGPGIFNPIDLGSSTDTYVYTTGAGAPSVTNLIGEANFNGAPLANFGFEISKENSTVNSITAVDANPHGEFGTISWSVNFSKGISGLTASNFALVPAGPAVSITSVTPVTATQWTVLATLGGGTGTVGLNLVNTTGLNTGLTNVPFTGDVYTITNVVPVRIEYLRGSQSRGANNLVWKVNSTAASNAVMALERSGDGVNFTPVNNVTADAARCLQEFNYNDNSPVSGINYYRLKLNNGSGHLYSNIVTLFDKKITFVIAGVQPNPATDKLTLKVAGAQKDNLTISVYDMNGRQVLIQTAQLAAGSNMIGIDVSRLLPGSYTISAGTADSKKETVSFIKQ